MRGPNNGRRATNEVDGGRIGPVCDCNVKNRKQFCKFLDLLGTCGNRTHRLDEASAGIMWGGKMKAPVISTGALITPGADLLAGGAYRISRCEVSKRAGPTVYAVVLNKETVIRVDKVISYRDDSVLL